MAYPPAAFDLSVSNQPDPPAAPEADLSSLAAQLTPDETQYLTSLPPEAWQSEALWDDPVFQGIASKAQAHLQAPLAPVVAPAPPPDPRVPSGGALDAVKALGLNEPKTWSLGPDRNAPAVTPPALSVLRGLGTLGALTASPAGKFVGSMWDQPGNLPAALTAFGREAKARVADLPTVLGLSPEEEAARRTTTGQETEKRFGPQPPGLNFVMDTVTDPASYIGGTPVDMVTALPHFATSLAGLALHPAILEKIATKFPNFAAVLRETVAGGGEMVRLGSLTRPSPVSVPSQIDSLQAFKELQAQGKPGAMSLAYKRLTPDQADAATHLARGEAMGASPADIAAFYVRQHGKQAEHVLPGARDFVRHLQQEGRPIHAGLWHDVMPGTPAGYTKVQSHFLPDAAVAQQQAVEAAAQAARRAESPIVRPAPPQLVGPSGQPVSSATQPRIYTPQQLSEGHLRLAPARQNAQGDVQLSTRIPWAVKAEAPASRAPLTTDLSTILQAGPEVVAKMAKEVRAHPLLTAAEAQGSDAEVLERWVEKAKDNILWLWDRPEVQAISPTTRQWYVGAQVRAYEDAPLIGVTPEQVAASIAALSPKKDWHENAELARRFGYVWRDLTDVNAPFDKEVFDHYRRSYLEGREGSVKWQKLDAAGRAQDLAEAKATLARERKRFQGVHFADLPKDGRARMIRAYAEVAFPTDFNLIRPTGEYGPRAMNADGKTASKLGWGLSQPTLIKALSALEDGRIVNISNVVGEAHKVRSFYNNIIDPWYPGAVTIDTHAIAAAHLMPLSLDDGEVTYAMGGLGDAMTGITGGNPLYAEAYNRAAKARGVLPREMQSVTWEALRGLFTPEQKSDKEFVAHVRSLWDNYRRDGGSLDALRQEILDFARKDSDGVIKPPDWTVESGGSARE